MSKKAEHDTAIEAVNACQDLLKEGSGWRKFMVPYLMGAVDDATADILQGSLDHDEYVKACAVRKLLLEIIAHPEVSLESNRATLKLNGGDEE